MATDADKLVSEIKALPDEDKLRVLDAILTDLDKPDRDLDHVGRLKREHGGPVTKQAAFQRCRTKNS